MLLTQIFYSVSNFLTIGWAYSSDFIDSLCSEANPCAKSTVATSDNIQANYDVKIGPTIEPIQRPKATTHIHLPSLESQSTNNSRLEAKTRHPFYVSKAKVPPIPPNRPLSAGIFQDGDDQSYFAEVYLGSERSKMYMLLDTGSSLSWVMGQNCTDPICTSRNTFGAQNSSTLEISDSQFSIKYGTGSCSGSIAHDTVSFAGLSVRVPLGIANTVSSDFGAFEIYGVINFGAPDTSRFTGEIVYHPLIRDGSSMDWEVEMTSVICGSTQIPMTERVLFDTGTSYIFAPLYFAYKVHALIPGAETKDNGTKWEVPCDTMLDIVFQLGSDLYSIPPAVWIRRPTTDGKCKSSLYGAALEKGKWIFGDVFLKNFYTVFDFDNHRIGIAKVQIPTLLSIQSPSSPEEDPFVDPSTVITGPVDPGSAGPGSNSGPVIPTSHKSNSSIRSTNVLFFSTLITLFEFGTILSRRRLRT